MMQWLQQYVREEFLNVILDVFKENGSLIRYLIFSVSRIGAPSSLGGFRFTNVNLQQSDKTSSSALIRKVEMIDPERIDAEAVLSRGGASIGLQEKVVSIVGCGAIGGHLAEMLASSGIGRLILVDNDKMKLENLHRHVLGYQNLGSKKAEALAELINSQYLYTYAKSYTNEIEKLIQIQKDFLSETDLIISGTGDPGINLFLNSHARLIQKPLLIGWLEPYGIGVHTVLIFPVLQVCFRCLALLINL